MTTDTETSNSADGDEAIFEAERKATLEDAQNPAALDEMRLWDSTLEDGID